MSKTLKISLCVFLTMVLLFSSMNVGAENNSPDITLESSVGLSTNGFINGESVLIYPSQTNRAISTTQYKNFLFPIRVNIEDVQYLSFDVLFDFTNSPNTFLSFYAIPSALQNQVLVYDSYDTGSYLYVNYEPEDLGSESEIVLYCGLNTTDTYQLAINTVSIDFGGGFTNDGNGINIANTIAVTHSSILMGDVGFNHVVNSGDVSDINLYINSNSFPPDWGDFFHDITNAHHLAADVDGDGQITYDDADLIADYVNGDLLSFWGTETIAQLPTQPDSGLITNRVYCLKNQNTGKYVYFSSDGTSSVLRGENEPVSSDYSKNLLLDCSGTYCTFRFGTGGYMQVDAFNNVVCPTSLSVNFSIFWYLIPKGGGYQIVNYEKTEKFLNGDFDLDLTREYSNSVWELEPLSVNIKYYYDMGYAVRVGSSVASSSIVDYQDDVRDIFSTVYGIALSTATPHMMQSYSDMCNNSSIHSSCGETHITGDQAEEDCAAYCENHNTIEVPESGELHHNNSKANLYHLYETKQSADHKNIQFLMSGHEACGSDIENSTVHEYGNVAGLANISRRVAVVFNDNPNIFYYKQLTMLHELSHCFGAGSAGESSKADTGEEENHYDCVMSYEDNKDHVYNAWNTQDYNALFCSSCRAEMKNYIMMNY